MSSLKRWAELRGFSYTVAYHVVQALVQSRKALLISRCATPYEVAANQAHRRVGFEYYEFEPGKPLWWI